MELSNCSILYVFWQVGYQWAVYATTLRSIVKSWLDILLRLLLSQWSSSDMNFQPLGWLNTTCTIVTCSGLWLWDLWDIYEWYCYFIAKLYWEAWGLFWKRSVSLFLRGVLFLVGCLLVFWLGCLVFVLAVCLCWLLLFGWLGDTLGIVSLYSHAWEWTISTNGLMTVRASSAHGTRKKKKAGGRCWTIWAHATCLCCGG